MKKSWYTPLVGLVTIALIVSLAAAILILPGLGIMHFIKLPNDSPTQRLLFGAFLTLGFGFMLYGAYKIGRSLYDMSVGVGQAVIEYWNLWREGRK